MNTLEESLRREIGYNYEGIEPGNFCFAKENEKKFLQDAYDAITRENLWDYIKHFDKSFASDDTPELDQINTHMKLYNMHSGASYSWVMNRMKYIAQVGWNRYVDESKKNSII